MNYRLGLDLGTNSIGWALFELDDKKKTTNELVDAGVRIFSDGREPSKGGRVGESLAVERRTARSMRRRRDRKLAQKGKLIDELVLSGLFPENINERKQLERLDPLWMRTKALDQKMKPGELARAIFHFVIRRGFKSNRLEKRDEENSKNYVKIDALKRELDNSGYRTLGEYLFHQKQKGQPIRFRPEYSQYYPTREMYQEEFFMIKEKQFPYYPDVNWERIERILFFQRPLKPQERGVCPYYSDKPRAFRALPSSQQFRIWQDIQNIEFSDIYGNSIGLSHQEQDDLFFALQQKKTYSFSQIKKVYFPGTDGKFNLEGPKRDKLIGNALECDFMKTNFFGHIWASLSLQRRDEIVENIITVYSEEDEKAVISMLLDLGVNEKNIDNILDFSFKPSGTTSMSKEIQQELISEISDKRIKYHEAIENLGFHHSVRDLSNDSDKLPYYGEILKTSCVGGSKEQKDIKQPEKYYGKIGNPTVHVALNQCRKVVNAIINKYGKPEQTVIELSRELKLPKERVNEINRKQAANQKVNDSLNEELKSVFGIERPSIDDRIKLKLYKEQMPDGSGLGAKCPYCGNVIGESRLFTSEIEIEHILPYSRTLDDSISNKVVSHKSCNQFKKNRSPFEAFGNNPEGFEYSEILRLADNLENRAKARRFKKDGMKFFTENDGQNFYDNQLNDNAYISRTASRYLKAVCPHVWVTTGKQTAMLRSQWGLNSILGKGNRKNRTDHRHHAIDAAVIAQIDRGLVKKMADLNKNSLSDRIEVPHIDGFREKMEEVIDKMLPSIKPDHGAEGRLFMETAYGQITLNLPIQTTSLKAVHLKDISGKKLREELLQKEKELGFKKCKEWLLEKKPSKIYLKKKVWVTTVPVTSIKEAELIDMVFDGKLQGPSDLQMRKKIREFVASRSGKWDKIMEDFSKETGIKSVRYIPKSQEIIPIKSMPGKGYQNNDFVYVDIWEVPPKKKDGKSKFDGVFVSRYDANQISFHYEKPHPAAKRVMRLYKNDVIQIKNDEGEWFYRIAGYSTTTNCLDIKPIWSSGDNLDWLASTNQKRIHYMYEEMKGHVFKTIGNIFSRGEVNKVKISPVYSS